MLESIRDPKFRTTFTAYFVFGIIILVFIFWGVVPQDQLTGGGYAASVNNSFISLADFRRAYDQQTAFFRQMMGGMGLSGEQMQMIQNRTLESLINQELLAQGAEEEGFLVSDAEVRDQIVKIPAFQNNGSFQRDNYRAFLQSQAMTAGEFESALRREASVEHFRTLLVDLVKPTPAELESELKASQLKLSVSFVKTDLERFLSKISDSQAAKFAEENPTKIQEFYDANKAKFSSPETITASHILITTEPGNEASEKSALEKINQIKARAEKEDFGKLAQEFSDDPGSKSKNGDLGSFSRGKMVPEFENVAFALEPGKVSEPVKTQFGYHLIKVAKKSEADTKALEDVKLEIAKNILAEERRQNANTQIEELLKSNNPNKSNELDKLVKNLGLNWENTGSFEAGASSVPKLEGVPSVSEHVSKLSPSSPLPDQLLRFGSSAYLLKLKEQKFDSSSKTAPDQKTLAGQIAQRRAFETLNLWRDVLAKDATIKRNRTLISQ